MNKQTIIGALLGGLILWIYQFLSWGMLDLHYSEMQYTDQQTQIMEALNNANLEEGDYFMPRAPKGASHEEIMAIQEPNMGKPWAMVQYRNSLSNDMPMNLTRGFIIDFLAAFLLLWILGKMERPDLITSVKTSIAVGLIGYLTIAYLNSIWFQGQSITDLLDALVSMGILGAFVGWWINR